MTRHFTTYRGLIAPLLACMLFVAGVSLSSHGLFHEGVDEHACSVCVAKGFVEAGLTASQSIQLLTTAPLRSVQSPVRTRQIPTIQRARSPPFS